LSEAEVGLSGGTFTGSYSLQSISGSPIVLSSSAGGEISRAGLSTGTYKANLSVTSTSSREPIAGTPLTTSLWTAGTMKINNVAISGTDPANDTASATVNDDGDPILSSSRSNSAIAIAAAINKASAETGVTAVVNANVITGGAFVATDLATPAGSELLVLNGVNIDLDSLDGTQTRQDVADLINAYSGRTGVVATDNGVGLTYTAADGRNISMWTTLQGADNDILGLNESTGSNDPIANDAGGATTAGTDAVTTYASFSLVSDKQFLITAGSEGGEDAFAAMGLHQGTFGGESNGFKVSDVDISTQDGASAALAALDAALDSVNFSQSRLGALQNRLDSAISNLSEVSRNTSESRSRILDADYATETTNLAKAQIVQQAATAMLAQANQSAQSVLSLLK